MHFIRKKNDFGFSALGRPLSSRKPEKKNASRDLLSCSGIHSHPYLQRRHKLHLWQTQPKKCSHIHKKKTKIKNTRIINSPPNPLHPSISMQILHTVLYTFPVVLTRRICLTIKGFLSGRSFHVFSKYSYMI